MLDDAEQVAALEPVVGRRRVPRLEGAGLVDAPARGEPVGEDLVEDRVPDPVRACRRSSTPRASRQAPARLRNRAGRTADDERRLEPSMLGRGRSRPSMTVRSRRTASSPLRRIGWWTVVSGGSTCGARSMSSKPTTLTSRGDREAAVAQRAHGADRHRVAHRQDGGRPEPVLPGRLERPRSRRRCWPARRRSGRPGCVDADRGERLAVAAQPSAGDAVRVRSPVDGAGGSTPIISTSRWPRPMRCSAAARAPPDVVDLDRAVLRQRGRVDEHDRHAAPAGSARPPGWSSRRADGDDAVDGRPAHRPGQAAVQRRDEVEARSRAPRPRAATPSLNAPKNGLREDDRQRLRREHADRQRLALGEHPGDRVRASSRAARRRRGSGSPSRAPADPGC